MTPAIVNTVAIILTIMVLSRIAGDNPLFRIAQYLFVGVSLGLAFVVAYHQALTPAVRALNAGQDRVVMYGIPLALGLLLLPRISRCQELAWLANLPLALVLAWAPALVVGGAIIGTLLPQIRHRQPSVQRRLWPRVVGAAVLAIGTVITLAAFYYTAPQQGPRAWLTAQTAALGHWLLMIAFGFFFANAVQSYLSALTERVGFVLRYFGLIG